jgi:hypothetical protein
MNTYSTEYSCSELDKLETSQFRFVTVECKCSRRPASSPKPMVDPIKVSPRVSHLTIRMVGTECAYLPRLMDMNLSLVRHLTMYVYVCHKPQMTDLLFSTFRSDLDLLQLKRRQVPKGGTSINATFWANQSLQGLTRRVDNNEANIRAVARHLSTRS